MPDQTEQQGPRLYKGDKGVNNAARPPECDPTEVWGLSASSLTFNIDRPAWIPKSPLKSLCTKQRLIELFICKKIVKFTKFGGP